MNSPVKIWRNQKRQAQLLGKTGSIVTWTIVRVPPAGFSEQAPYAVCVVSLDNGTTITAQLVDCSFEKISVGLRVLCVLRRVRKVTDDGVIGYGVKVKPME